MGYGHPVSLIPNGLRTAEWRISDTLCHSDLPDTFLSLAHEIRALPWGPLSRSPRDGTFGVAVGILGRYTAHYVWTGDGGISLKTCLKHGF